MKKLQREQAYEKLRDAITYGDLKPGSNLTEKELSDKFNFGRTPIREAFRQLQMEGYIEVLPNKGAIVRRVSAKEIEDVYDVLALLEGHAVELAAAKITKAEISELEKEIQSLSQTEDHEEWFIKNDSFHQYFITLAGNMVLEEEVKKFRRRIYRYRSLVLSIQGNTEKLLKEHELIVLKLFEKSPEEAGKAMREHVRSAKDLLVKFFQNNSWI